MFRHHPINWLVVVFVLGYHLLAFSALAFPFQWQYLPIMIGMYLWMGLGTTFYLHRCLTHKAFETNHFIKFFFFLATSVGQQGDPINWVGHHRWHHAKSDQAEDVHSPVHGFWHSHMGWIFRNPGEDELALRKLARDVEQSQPYLRYFTGRVRFFLPHLAAAGLLTTTLGWGGLLWCLYVPIIAVYHVTWSVNSLCHMFGYRRTETADQSRNFWPIGILALGEGWHNNHHACQTRAPQGLVWWEFDATSYLIKGLEKLGWVWNVKWTAPVRKTESVTGHLEAQDATPVVAASGGMTGRLAAHSDA
ncbi:MAG: acyl-CoA desaturase [Candidatus Sericytochromatia bacterium]|nr:acyl-CoA desaturase [Candidatus Sericytochromatia bacterium]